MVLATLEPTLGMKCIQHILLAFNAIFTFTGVILISVGSTVNSLYSEYAEFIESRFFSPSIVIITIGILVLIIALFGCYGAFKLSVAAIMVYCIFLTTIFILETIAGTIGYLLEDDIQDMLARTLTDTMQEYQTDNVTARAVDKLQYELHCCGVNGIEDWSSVMTSDDPDETVLPMSCCAYYERGQCRMVKVTGCLSQLQYLVGQSSILLTSTVLMIALMQLLGVVFAYKLGRQLRKQKTLRDHFKWQVREDILSAHSETLVSAPPAEYSRLPSYSEIFSSKNEKETMEKA